MGVSFLSQDRWKGTTHSFIASYLAIAIFVFLLAGIFFISNIPEITDSDMALQIEETHVGSSDKPFRKQYRLFHAAVAQWCYTGAQVAIAGYFINYVVEVRSNTSSALAAKFLAVAQGCFTVGRFSGSILMRFIRPRWVFLFYISMVIVFNAASITQGQNTGLAMLMLTLFFESVCFPTIVALGIRGLGRHTKRGAGLIVAGVSGGACVPPILAVVADARHSTAFAMVVPVMFFVVAYSYAVCVNFVPGYRDPADKIATSGIGLRGRRESAVTADTDVERGDEIDKAHVGEDQVEICEKVGEKT
jgi:FHS family L-fucose permease-like MFS transporter